MNLHFCSFSSGSSGNCYLIKTESTAVLVDAGISGRKIMDGLEKTGTERELLTAVLVTHEHSDHVKSLKTLTKKNPQIKAYANRGTWPYISELVKEEQRALFETGEDFTLGDITVRPFSISHDAAEPVGFSFFGGEKQISILTDTGYLSEEIFAEIRQADLLVLEANHDVEMLRVGRYPWFLKQRILGKRGHLSNTDAAFAICRLIREQEKYRHVLLAHLSRENNFPEMAYQTIKNLLEEADYFIGQNVYLNVIARDELSAIYTL